MSQPSERKILVVDDDPDQIQLIRAYLEEAGYSVETAMDGVEALAKAKALLPDLITLDILMPKMNGLEVLDALKEDPHTQSIPVVVITVTEKVDLVTGPSPQVVDYLTKPIDFDAMLHSIQRAIRQHLPEALAAQRAKILVADDDPEV